MPEFTSQPEQEPSLQELITQAEQEAAKLRAQLAEEEAEYEEARQSGDYQHAEDVKPARAVYAQRIEAAVQRAAALRAKLSGDSMQDIQDIATKHRGEDE